jgi:hypothetical protein
LGVFFFGVVVIILLDVIVVFYEVVFPFSRNEILGLPNTHHRRSIFNALVVLGETDDLLMAFSRAILPLAKSPASKNGKKIKYIYTYILCVIIKIHTQRF